jgi:fibronectin-binding autotransporter adhesin
LDYTFQGIGRFSGAMQLIKDGTGTLTLNNGTTYLPNDFDGSVEVRGGTLKLGGGSLGNTNGATVVAGGSLDFNGRMVGGEPLVVQGSGLNGIGALYNSGSGGNACRFVTLAGDTAFGGTGRWNVVRGGDRNAAFLSTGGQPYRLTKLGSNQISIISATVDPALGDIDVQQGLLSFENDTSSMGNPASNCWVRAGATLAFWGTTNLWEKNFALFGDGTNISLYNWSGANTLAGPVALNGDCLVTVAGTTLTARRPFTGTGVLRKAGTGTLILAGTNTFSGGAHVSAGTLQFGNGGIGGDAGSGSVTNDAGTLQFNRSDDFTWSTPVSGTNGFFVKLNTNTMTLAATNYYLGPTIGGSRVNGGTLILAPQGRLIAANEFWAAAGATTGQCIINGGTLIVTNWVVAGRAHSAALGSIVLNSGLIEKHGWGTVVLGSLGGSGTLTVNGGLLLNDTNIWLGESAGGKGYLNLNGGCTQARAITRATTTAGSVAQARFNGGILQATENQTNYLAVDQALVQTGGLVFDDAGFTVTFRQPLLADTNSPGGGLLKLGAGTLQLNATNTFTGQTIVSNGCLGGTGVLVSPVHVATEGRLATGNGISRFTISNALTLQGAVFLKINKAGGVTNCDVLAGLTSVAYGGQLIVTNTGALPFAEGDSFKLFEAASYSGNFTGFTLPALDACLGWDWSRLPLDGSLRVVMKGPRITQQPLGRTILPGTSVTLQVQATSDTPLRYQWRLNVADIPGATNATFTRVIQSGQFGNYTVLVGNDACGVESAVALVKSFAAPAFTARLNRTTFSMAFATELGVAYVVEYSDSLAPGQWHELYILDGTGSAVTVTDSIRNAERRFYRLRLE